MDEKSKDFFLFIFNTVLLLYIFFIIQIKGFPEHVIVMRTNFIGSCFLCLLATAVVCMDSTGRECGDLGPPPSILDMPPPPMPSFLAAVLEEQSDSNDEMDQSNKELLMETNELDSGKPCKSMCDLDQGVGFVELPQQGLNFCRITFITCLCIPNEKLTLKKLGQVLARGFLVVHGY